MSSIAGCIYGPNFFQAEEFRLCIPSCDISQMNRTFMVRLNYARELADVPFILNSAYRSSDWDKSKGRSGTGYHTKGRAVDVVCKDSVKRARIVDGCLRAGLSVGIHRDFIHIDDRVNQIIFLY